MTQLLSSVKIYAKRYGTSELRSVCEMIRSAEEHLQKLKSIRDDLLEKEEPENKSS